MDYETVVGLEVHVELATKTKIFCGCGTGFGAEPNTQVCPVCSGMPGSLPVFNKEVARFAALAGLALNCEINRRNVFDRKNYFYPDLPKAYQISQLYQPICRNGFLEIGGGKKIGIHEIHMEEDAGKLLHDPWEDCSNIDYNRCGVPLIEIVSEPDFRSAGEVVDYLERLREILLYLGVSDCKMQEGSMRADINLSVRPSGAAEFGVRTEMKNMNSFKAIYRAVEFEAKRQTELIDAGGRVTQETRRWDDNKEASFSMRSKENAQDYRYFPDPDLLALDLSEEFIEEIRANMPESAASKRSRFTGELGLSAYDAGVLTAEKPLCDLFERTSALCGNPKEAANLIIVEICRLIKEDAATTEDACRRVAPESLAALIKMITGGEINRTVGKDALAAIFREQADPEEYVRERNLLIVNDAGLIDEVIDRVLEANEKSVADFRAGKEKAFGFLVGQAMKELKGTANPGAVNGALKKRLGQ
ncbi:MAG: Asp-tRNA(Asn)/Glu-tRNA(Gln) amidotransferase subunit GatB [Clostridiales bacterium]|jgi:aspartyl-tRNA(Asn)/glutamyl-tRNA(Gln) amidotransferase subunit B|nr:Asp-tRNA(Asn)/Glu-tRNA(Gln) amidotransferase subunit GatB [Clostridiales bacterium]